MNPRLIACAAFSAIFASIAFNAQAADMPKRKSGLWEIRSQMSGMPQGAPAQPPIQMCIDQNSDNVMRDRAQGKADCPTMEMKHGSGQTTIHMVCKHEGFTSTTDGVLTGDFESSYKSDMTMRYDPPQHGMKEMKMMQDARWLGPCKAGQRPGDIIMPGMPKMNMQDMMKDPQIKEMMKRQPQGR